MIGILGYGFVGKAVEHGFPNTKHIISDPAYNDITIQDIVNANPEVIFVCLPTPSDNSDYAILKGGLKEIQDSNYKGIVAVKSTILPRHLDGFDVVLNPEFLSRKTALTDFTDPPFVLFGGPSDKTKALYEIYKKYSIVDLTNVKYTDIKTASLAKYTFNSFYSTKITFMNQIYDVCEKLNINFEELKDILKMWPWMMGVSHLDVPGHEGRGFSGPCLPKDTTALSKEFDLELLKGVLELNTKYRKEEENGSN